MDQLAMGHHAVLQILKAFAIHHAILTWLGNRHHTRCQQLSISTHVNRLDKTLQTNMPSSLTGCPVIPLSASF